MKADLMAKWGNPAEREAVKLAAWHGCEVEAFEAQTLRGMLEEAEQVGATVAWGCYSDEDLNSVVRPVTR